MRHGGREQTVVPRRSATQRPYPVRPCVEYAQAIPSGATSSGWALLCDQGRALAATATEAVRARHGLRRVVQNALRERLRNLSSPGRPRRRCVTALAGNYSECRGKPQQQKGACILKPSLPYDASASVYDAGSNVYERRHFFFCL